eukprot:s2728_g4.t1
MSVLEALKWANFNHASDEATSTEGKAGVPRFDGGTAKLSEYAFRVRMRQTREKSMSEDELKKMGGEDAIASYVLRRRAWYRTMTDLDPDLKLPDGILAEQLLLNAGISDDHKLLVRTAIQGNMTWDSVCEELVAQHSRVHERESKGGGFSSGKSFKSSAFKGYGRGGGSYSKGKGWKSYYANDEHDMQDSWESASQSLGGYEDVIDDSTAYHGDSAELYEDEYDPVLTAFQAMVDEGLDENDMESAEHAAEILQCEAEAYYARMRAQETGHYGFWGQHGQERHYQVHGSLSLEEKKQRIQSLKAKSSCRRCGQTGHWSNDAECPKGKGRRKGGSSTISTASTSKGGKAHSQKGKAGGKPGDKPRTVYFAINEYTKTSGINAQGYMVLKETGKTADQMLDELIAVAQRNRSYEANSMLANSAHLPGDLMAEHAALVHVGESSSTTTWGPSPERRQYLDLYLELVNDPTDPEWQDANAERWSEFVPGHPLFTENDMVNLRRWKRKEQLGLPQIPEHLLQPVPEDEMDHDLFDVTELTEEQLRQQLGIDPGQTPGSLPTPTPVTPPRTCDHVRTTKQGSNDHKRVVKCKDCGMTLMEEKLTPAESMKVESPHGCLHEDKNFQGTTGTTWRWTCRKCGHVETGQKSPGESARSASARSARSGATTPTNPSPPIPTPSCPPSSSSATLDEDHDVDKIVDLVRHVVDVQRDMGHTVSVAHLDRIYDRCRTAVLNDPRNRSPDRSRSGSAPRPASATPTSVAPSLEPESEGALSQYDGTVLYAGAYHGRTYADIFKSERSYAKTLVGKMHSGTLRDENLIKFARYAARRLRQERDAGSGSGSAYMVASEDAGGGDSRILAILDTGCNNTCHGDRWMQRFAEAHGHLPELEDAEGKFRGVGGKVAVAGKRTIPMKMRTLDDEMIAGTIASIELQDSEAPLLLSAGAQQALGLVLDMGNNTIYSRTLDKELDMVMYNGLPSIVLHPGEIEVGSIALNTMDIFDSMDTDDTTDASVTNDQADDDVLIEYHDTDSDVEPYADNLGGSSYMPISEGKVKIMSKKQRKHLQDSLHDVEKEDCAMWSTLGTEIKRPRKMLPRGCKSFLMEIFAGAATLSTLAVGMGLSISPPIDVIYDDRYNLLKKANRDALEQLIEVEDPFLLTMAPICGPWSSWQHVNMAKDDYTKEKILEQRKEWYSVLQWMAKVIRSRLAKGREVLVENPWPSLIWQLRCLEDIINEPLYNSVTDEPLELKRIDQCMYGLVDEQSGVPHQKATGLLLSSRKMKDLLQLRCDGSHWHQQLEGGIRTKKAQQWPETLCFSIIMGAVEEMKNQVMRVAFATEAAQEDQEEMGPLDGVFGPEDVEEMPAKRRRIDLDELDREEDYEEQRIDKADELLATKEKARRENWLKISKDQRIALRRLHAMMGHCSKEALIRMLRASGCDKHVIKAAQYFRCPSCDEIKKQEQPRVTKPMREPHQMQFNKEVSIDVFEIHDAQGGRHSVLSMVDMATHYQVAVRLCAGGTPSSKLCADAMNLAWFTPFGSPEAVVTDQGVHNSGKVRGLLLAHGIEIRRIGAQAPHQLGTGERHGGLLKAIMQKAIHNRQLGGAEAMSALCAETSRVKNVTINLGGFSPAQWVLGHTPTDWSSLVSHDGERHLGLHQNLVDLEEDKTPQESFMIQLLIRQAAKEAFIQVDSCNKIRKAMLRKAVPIRGPYRVGNMVNFERRGKWYGPARVLAYEGRSSLWLVHGGVTILVAETSCRPSSTEEIFKKDILERRPIRKRRHHLISMDDLDGDNPMEQVPFSRDGDEARHLRPRYDGQAPFVDTMDVPAMDAIAPTTSPPGVATTPVGADVPADQGAPLLPELPAPLPDPGLEMEVHTPPGLESVVPTPSLISTLSSQPEREVDPETVMSEETSNPPNVAVASQPASVPLPVQPPVQVQEYQPQAGTLNQALRNSPARLDGHPRAYVTYEEKEQWAFLLTRQGKSVEKKVKKYAKKNQKTGAGREVIYDKMTPDIQKKMDAAREKEWGNWKKYTNGKWISEKELKEMRKEHPTLKVIPTRWVEVDKAEVGQEPIMKSRIVVRGDLEDASKMRTDAPTCSQLMISTVFAMAACRDVDLWAGDISAAFLQGSAMDRILVLRMPKGLPEDADDYYVVSTTVYGTKDGPRGWYKNLHSTVVQVGLRPVPHEQAAFVLNDASDGIAGLAIIHVDDILWTGGAAMEAKMQEIVDIYKFGKIEKNEFKYCGRQVLKDAHGVHVTCPSLIDRVKPIYMSTEERKNKKGSVSEHHRQQLRSVVGSLAWLTRVCRPDLAYSVNYLQSQMAQATYEDIAFANKIIAVARNSKDKGLHYPVKLFEFEQAVIVGIQDASFANDSEVNEAGKKSGFRSQSGRLVCLAGPTFKDTKQGNLLILDWHSTTIKRVCRSTLQAETMSLLSGLEECEHVRMVLHGLHREHHRYDKAWQIEAMDYKQVELYTDCRSLEEYVNQSGLHSVSDKRLAIDLTGIRQQIWRKLQEEVGDPLITDRLPLDATTRLHWLCTEKMAADCLTKAMKPGSLETVFQVIFSEAPDLKNPNLLLVQSFLGRWHVDVCFPLTKEVERLEDLTKGLLSAQNQNCSSPLLVFVGERRWESAIAKLQLHVRPPFVVRTSVDFENGPCHRHMLPSGSFNAFASIVQDCETWWEEACDTGTWYMAAPLRPVINGDPRHLWELTLLSASLLTSVPFETVQKGWPAGGADMWAALAGCVLSETEVEVGTAAKNRCMCRVDHGRDLSRRAERHVNLLALEDFGSGRGLLSPWAVNSVLA